MAENKKTIDRRTLLTSGTAVVATAVGVAYLGGILMPVYKYVESPLLKELEESKVTEMIVGKVFEVPLNSSKIFKFGSRPVIVIHHADNTFKAFTATCTHLGCTVQYMPEAKDIYCACHGGHYDAQTGKNIAGPPPKPLTELKVSIINDEIKVSRV